MLDTPVLLLIFNRPDTTQKVFEAIRQARPRQLFIAADGPRPGVAGEAEKCEQARSIASEVDWNCEVKTLFREENLGCKLAVSSAIDWYFSQVEEGIILEDDTLPNQSFFRFCAVMLAYYRNTLQVMHISGDNFQNDLKRGNASYYFSAVSHIWGWATWRRAWQHYDVHMNSFQDFKRKGIITRTFQEKEIQDFWLHTFELVYEGKINTWDVQWAYTCILNNGLAVMPNVNLVTNIGFREDATHTTEGSSSLANIPAEALGEIRFLKKVSVDIEADLYTAKNHFYIKFSPARSRFSLSYWISRIKRKTAAVVKPKVH